MAFELPTTREVISWASNRNASWHPLREIFHLPTDPPWFHSLFRRLQRHTMLTGNAES